MQKHEAFFHNKTKKRFFNQPNAVTAIVKSLQTF